MSKLSLRAVAMALCAFVFSTVAVHAVEKAAGAAKAERFYGKIASIDASSQKVVVHNKKQNVDSTFRWSGTTVFQKNKNPITVGELQPGQFVVVWFQKEGEVNRAEKIQMRPAFGRPKAEKAS